MMRADFGWVCLLTLALLLASGFGCKTPAAYGPSGDERLEMAVDGGPVEETAVSPEQLAELQSNACADLADQVERLKSPPMMDAEPSEEEGAPNLEEDHLAALTGAVRELRRRRDTISGSLVNNPDLRFFSGPAADGRTYDIPELSRVCELVLQDAEIALDGYIRELLNMPIISDVERVGRRTITVPRERVDFALLKMSIEVLAPFDADSLVARVDSAASRLEEEKEQSRRPPPRRRRR